MIDWLRDQCAGFTFDLRGVFRRTGPGTTWPLTASGPEELEQELTRGGHLLPLPKESAALANVLEVSIVDFVLDRLNALEGATAQRGTERGYPDLEVSGPAFGGGYHAVDVKCARLAEKTRGAASTQSAITLYTGNTYFRWPHLHWPGTFRPFGDYTTHVDILMIYRLQPETNARLSDLEIIVQEPWRIASKRRSSKTREYIGAVQQVDRLREGRGEFETPEAFYDFWRKYPFNISAQVQKQLDRLIREQRDEIDRLRRQGEGESGG